MKQYGVQEKEWKMGTEEKRRERNGKSVAKKSGEEGELELEKGAKKSGRWGKNVAAWFLEQSEGYRVFHQISYQRKRHIFSTKYAILNLKIAPERS